MLRAFFLAMGIFAFVLGLECLVIEKAVLNPSRDGALAQMAPGLSRSRAGRMGPLEPALGRRRRHALLLYDSRQDASLSGNAKRSRLRLELAGSASSAARPHIRSKKGLTRRGHGIAI